MTAHKNKCNPKKRTEPGKKKRSILLSAVMVGVIALLFIYVWPITPSWVALEITPGDFFYDVSLYRTYAVNILGGQIPYHDFAVEYPPFALPFFVLPGLFSDNLGNYIRLFGAMTCVFTVAGLFLTGLLCRLYQKNPIKPMLAYTVAAVFLGPITPIRFDIFAAVLTLAALYMFLSDRHLSAWFLLALATATKLYPIFLAPVFLILYLPDIRKCLGKRDKGDGSDPSGDDFRNRTIRRIVCGIGVFIATGLLVSLPFMLADISGFLSFLTYHMDRGLQIESLASSCLMMLGTLGISPVDISYAFNYGSSNIAGVWPDRIAGILTPLLMIILTAVYVLFLKAVIDTKVEDTSDFLKSSDNCRLIMMTSFAIVLTFILVSKVLSPQYMIWLLPFVPFLLFDKVKSDGDKKMDRGRKKNAKKTAMRSMNKNGIRTKLYSQNTHKFQLLGLFLFIAVCILTFEIYPVHYPKLNSFDPGMITLLFIRNVLLVMLFIPITQIGRGHDRE